MRRFGFSALMVVLFFCATPEEAESQLFRTVLTGDQEVPPVETEAKSTAFFRFLFNNRILVGIRFNVATFEDSIGAHIHVGTVGENGPIILNLQPDARNFKITRFITVYYATAAQLRGIFAGLDLAALRNAMETGLTYFNVHTDTNPGGEVRGQIPGLE